MTLPEIWEPIPGIAKWLFRFWTRCFWVGHKWGDEKPRGRTCQHCGGNDFICPY